MSIPARFRLRSLAVATCALSTALVGFTGPVVQTAHATTSVAHPNLPLGLRAVLAARKQVGKPYVYGAAGPRAFDCSGLTQYAYAAAGRRLPHNALQQYKSIRHVAISQLRPGDLVFMNFTGGSAAGITHVGIYAGGGNWYVAKKPGTRITVQHIWTHRGLYAGRP
ncbi:MAG: C40 family peptidase [Jatrophihabitantaceae bacterium]